MADLQHPTFNFVDTTQTMQKALRFLDKLATNQTLEEIQSLATDGKLEFLFPDLFKDELTPELPMFKDLMPAPTLELSEDEFQDLLRKS